MCTPLNDKLTQHFASKGIYFQATYVTAVRDWCGSFATYGSTYGAYRKRSIKDKKTVPHSFTMVRRDSFSSRFSKVVPLTMTES